MLLTSGWICHPKQCCTRYLILLKYLSLEIAFHLDSHHLCCRNELAINLYLLTIRQRMANLLGHPGGASSHANARPAAQKLLNQLLPCSTFQDLIPASRLHFGCSSQSSVHHFGDMQSRTKSYRAAGDICLSWAVVGMLAAA